jgi:uncharacterized membrane protein
MKTRLLHLWHVLNSSYWFVPTLMILGSVLLAVATLWLDRSLRPGALEDAVVIYLGGAEGARTLLSTVASSVITVAGVVFSITIAALTQASSQFGPRLLRNFMRDTGNQIVLGTFVATFMYCLLVLRTVYGDNGAAFVPHVSVTAAVAMAAASIGVLIYFIHHVSTSLQAPIVAAVVARDLKEAIQRIYPSRIGQAGPMPSPDALQQLCHDGRKVASKAAGYLQAIDEDRLIECARHHDVVIRLLCRPGDFITTRCALAEVQPPDRGDDRAFAKEVNGALLLGDVRTSEQDVEFAIDQLVEIAVRALSPGINDPFTAMHCVDWLGDAVGRLAQTELPTPYRYDSDGELRVIARLTDFDGICDAAFDQIRQYGRGSVAVTARLLEAIAAAADSTRTPEQRAALMRHARMIEADSEANFKTAHDRSSIMHRYERAIDALSSDLERPASSEPAFPLH